MKMLLRKVCPIFPKINVFSITLLLLLVGLTAQKTLFAGTYVGLVNFTGVAGSFPGDEFLCRAASVRNHSIRNDNSWRGD